MAKNPESIASLKAKGKYEPHRHGPEVMIEADLMRVIPYGEYGALTAEQLYEHVVDILNKLGGSNRPQGTLIKAFVDNWLAIGKIDQALAADEMLDEDDQLLTVGTKSYVDIARLRMAHEKRMSESLKDLGMLSKQTRGFKTKSQDDLTEEALMKGPGG